jgi:hypothetical protein
MSMSDHERALLVTGTLDTSGVGGSPYARLDQVAVAFGAPVAEEAPEPEEKAAEKSPSEPEASKAAEDKPSARAKRAPAKKVQASASADE